MQGISKLRTTLLNEFRLVANVISHVLSDLEIAGSKQVVYNFDYNLLYPWLWRHVVDPKDSHYDLIGRNIFALYPTYSSDTAFVACFTVPSILELLDTLEHQHERSEHLASSTGDIDNIINAFKIASSPEFDVESDSGRKIDRILNTLPFSNENMRLNQLLVGFRNKQFTVAHHLFDNATLRAALPSIKQDCGKLFDRMKQRRSLTDNRRLEDKMFHYKVDCWNIAFRLINDFVGDKEVSYVCRQAIRDYYPGNTGQFHSRHPLVPMYHLYSLLLAPNHSNKHNESVDFFVDALRTIRECVTVIEAANDNLSNISFYWREKIDDAYNRFIRPLFSDYSDDARGIHMKEYELRRREARYGDYKSILTTDGFRDRFKQRAESFKNLATEVVDLHPEITSDRLLEEYDLSQNPRVSEIFKKFNL